MGLFADIYEGWTRDMSLRNVRADRENRERDFIYHAQDMMELRRREVEALEKIAKLPTRNPSQDDRT